MSEENSRIIATDAEEIMQQMNKKIEFLEKCIGELDNDINDVHFLLHRTVSCVHELERRSFVVNDNIGFLYYADDQTQ